MGMTHRLTVDYPDPGDDLRREHWHGFDYLNVRKYLPASESVIIDKAEELVERLKKPKVTIVRTIWSPGGRKPTTTSSSSEKW